MQNEIPATQAIVVLRDALAKHIKATADQQTQSFGADWAVRMVLEALILTHPDPGAFESMLLRMRKEMSRVAAGYADPGAVMYQAEEDIEHYLVVARKAQE